MLNLMNPLLGSSLFIPHGHCYLWNPELVGLHIFSDALIALAYYSIPLTLFYFVHHRSDLPFTRIFLLFSVFIVACGTTHLMEIWTLWYPTYWLLGGVKLLTAAVSVVTALQLVSIVPKALALPSSSTLEAAYWALKQEVAERERITQELICSRDLREAIFNESADALFLVDAQTLLTLDCNRRAVELFEADDPSQLLGIEGHMLQRYQFSPDEISQIVAEIRSQGFWSREIEYITCRGNCFWGNIAVKPITVAERQINLVRVTDISDRKRSEANRQQAELAMTRLAAIVESSGDAIIGKSLDGVITSWNASAERLFGYRAEEVIGQPIALLIPPDCADELPQILEQMKRGETIERYETVRVRKEGQRIDVSATLSPIKDAAGQVIGVSKIARDISQRKQAEMALRESETRFQTFMDNSPAASWIADAEGKILYLSQTYFRMFQISDLAVGQSIFDLFERDIAEEFYRNNQQVLETKQSIAAIEVAPRPDGTLGKFLVYKFPIGEQSGQVVVGAVAVDITEQEQVKEQLRSLNERLQYLLTHAPVAIFSCKAEGDYGATSMSENIRTILGYAPQDFWADASFWANHIHPDDRDRVLTNLPHIFVTGHHAHEYRFLHADGRYRWVYNQLQLMRDEAGHPVEMIGYLVDISDRKQAEQALLEREAFLRAIGDNIPNGYLYQLIREPQGHYRYTYVSAGLERVSGLKPEAVLADASLMFNLVVPEDLPALLQAAEVSAQNLSVFNVQVREQLANGEIHWLQLCSKPRQLANGQVIWDGIRLDINDLKQTEESLRLSEARNLAMLSAIPDLLLRVRRDGSCLDFIAPAHSQASSYIPIHTHISEVLPPHLLQHQMERIDQALATGKLQIWEHQLIKNGELQDEEIRLIPCGADEVLLIVRDISDRKRTEETLRRYERIVSATTDAILLLDRNYKYQVVNQAYLNWYGKQQDEVIGHSISTLLPEALFEKEIKPRLDLCLAGQAIQYEMWVNYPTLGPQFLSITYDPYFDAQQTPAGVVVSLRNITRLKQAEMELELQAIIVSNIAEGVCMVRIDDGIIVYANPKFERMFGYEPGELKDRHVSIINYADEQASAAEIHNEIEATVTQQGEATYEVHNVKKDGTPIWCRATTSIFQHSEHGAVLVAVQQDITEQKRAAEQIKVSLREKEVLLKEIHHRVKNNLGIVDGLLQMQSRRSSYPEVVATLRESQNRIASIALVHEKLYGSEDLANIDFAQYIADLTAHLFDSYNTHANQIKLTTQIEPISLDIDTAVPCGLIINELVSNALKYAFNAQIGEIQVIFQQSSDHMALIVRDNGIGLPQDFDLKQTKTLGMTLVKGLVKQLKGTLDVNTQQGTTFTINLNRP